MNKWLVTIFILFVGFSSYSQPRERQMERIHAAKMAFIIDRLRLTDMQAGNFIPLYNDMEKEIRAIRKEFMGKYKDMRIDETDDTTSRQYIDDNLDYQERVISIRRKYNDRFLKIIAPQQLSDLPKVEREFKRILMKQMERRNNMNGGGWNRSGPGRGY